MTDGIRGGLQVEDARVAAMVEDDGVLDAIQLSAGSSLMNPMYLFRGPVPLREFAAAMPSRCGSGCGLWGAGSSRSTPTRRRSCCRRRGCSASGCACR